jgi:nitrite reductase (NO-forming)
MQADPPDLVTFNGYPSQYSHRPLTAAAGERVRFWVLDAGPNRPSAFHVVGTQFDTVGGFVETVFPEPGHYPFISHILVDADRGARGTVTVHGAG